MKTLTCLALALALLAGCEASDAPKDGKSASTTSSSAKATASSTAKPATTSEAKAEAALGYLRPPTRFGIAFVGFW